MKILGILLALLPSILLADFNSGLDASALSIQYMMADPPLPLIHHKKGTYKATFKPGFIFGDTVADYEYGGGASSHQEGDVKGLNLGGSYSYSFGDKWGSYIWLVGTSLSGDYESTQNGQSSPSIFSRDSKITHFNLSAGISYQMRNRADDGYGFSFFMGPYIPYYDYSQRYINQNEGLEVDIESQEMFVGALVGLQWDFIVAENWGLNPFFLFGDTFGSKDFFNPFGDGGECRSYKVARTYSGNFNTAGIGEIDCDNKKEFVYDTQIGGIGLNLTYRPWDLTVNLFASLINQYIFRVFYEEERPELYYFSLSWNFGTFER